MKIFVSYSSADRKVVEEVVDRLRECGFDVLVDFLAISPGDEWREKLREAIKGADGMVAVVSSSYLSSEFCRMELETAMIFHGFLCTPILIDDCWDRLLADETFSELCGNVPIDFYRGEFAGLKVPRERLTAKLIEGFSEARNPWGQIPGADVVVGALPRDNDFAQALAEAIRSEGLTAYTIPERGYAGQAVRQLMYSFMASTRFCVLVVSEDCLKISSITGSFALASEEHGLPVLAVATPELSEKTAALAEEIKGIQKMDRVFARVLDRQLVLANRPLSEVARDVRTAMVRARRSKKRHPEMGLFGEILNTLKHVFQKVG